MKRASLFGFFLWLGLSRAGAQEGPVVRVHACEAVSESELTRLLGIELAELPDGGRAAEIQVRCEGNRVEIGARAQATGAPRTLTLEVGAGERDALARLLSLRIAELLETVEPAPLAAPDPAPTPARLPDREPERPRRHAMTAAFALRHMGSEGLWSYGARIGYDAGLGPLVLASDLSVTAGHDDTSLARVNVRDVSLGLGVSYRRSLSVLDLRIGPGVRLGYAFLSARDYDASYRSERYAAAWFGPFVALSVALHGRSPWQGLLGAEAGYVTVPVRGNADDGTRLVTLEGVWLTLTLGLAYAF